MFFPFNFSRSLFLVCLITFSYIYIQFTLIPINFLSMDIYLFFFFLPSLFPFSILVCCCLFLRPSDSFRNTCAIILLCLIVYCVLCIRVSAYLYKYRYSICRMALKENPQPPLIHFSLYHRRCGYYFGFVISHFLSSFITLFYRLISFIQYQSI